jgi:hypothetical protein
MNVTEADYRELYRRRYGHNPPELRPPQPTKPHKYHAKRVTVDGHNFPSLWEAKCYTALRWRYLGGHITEPLLQVRFSLGVHYGKERAYVCDFVFVELRSGTLVVADAKGFRTEEYKRKRDTFRCVYGFPVLEIKRT